MLLSFLYFVKHLYRLISIFFTHLVCIPIKNLTAGLHPYKKSDIHAGNAETMEKM